MDTSLKIVIIGGILLILMVLFLEKREPLKVKISFFSMAICFLMAGVLEALVHVQTVHLSSEMIRFLRSASQISFGMALGIILTLRIFGQFKFTKRNW
ncbi:MAG: hypothetical protein ABSD77_04480 [Verrucomicrobiota bacterium]|jgi:hypothetical protein